MENQTVLIIGGTGSWGRGLIKELLSRGVRCIKIYARNEFQMVKLLQEFNTPELEPVIGDIRDRNALLKACLGCDTLFHLAALKHVPICEKMPEEAIATNVAGTQNVIDCAAKARIERVVYVSTDKAVHANCTYGCTKLLGEKLMLAADESSNYTRYIVFRGGNLLGSTGSVIPLFTKQIADTKTVTLTDERMTRFFITIEKASRLLAEIAVRSAGGEIFLPVMPSLCIKDIAGYLLQKNGLDHECMKIIGIRPGEKLHEQMLAENELDNLYRLNDELVLISPNDRHSWAANGIMEKNSNYVYQSDKAALSCEQTETFLRAANL